MTSLYQKLVSADQVCSDCGTKYGKYSVGCSSVWEGTCDVCGETTGVTEVRDYGYLTKGINELKPRRAAEPFSNLTKDFTPERKAKIKEQSKKVAEHMATVGPIMSDDELENCLTTSYEQGEITLKLTKDEVGFLNQCLDTIQENHPTLCPGHTDEDFDDVPLFESVERKICDLYADECVTYELSPALKAYYEKYGEYGTGEYALRWEGFRDAFNAGFTSS
jgi:hypothetical protein